jgi:hypothetical protein
MLDFDLHRMKVGYHGLAGLSEIGFRNHTTAVADLFPTADEVVLSMRGYFCKWEQSASIVYEVPDLRFDVAESEHVLELAVPNPKGQSTGVIIDILALDPRDAAMTMQEIEAACGFIRARLSDAMRIMEISERDYLQRLKSSVRLLENQLRR